MKIIFIYNDIIINETNNTHFIPQKGWNIIIKQIQYIIMSIDMNYDIGIISINLTKTF